MISKYKKLIPKKLKVGGSIYKISFPWQFETNASGLHASYLTEIRISGFEDGEVRPLPKIYEILLHETMHAIDHIYMTFPLIHDSLDSMSIGLLQVILENDLRLTDDKYIPKKVKIGGLNYDVITNHPFTDDIENIYSACFDSKLRILLKCKEVDGDINDRFIKQGLMFCIIHAIINTYVSNGMVFDLVDNGNTIPNKYMSNCFNVLAHGIYQVFVDNNLENVIRNGIKTWEKEIKK